MFINYLANDSFALVRVWDIIRLLLKSLVRMRRKEQSQTRIYETRPEGLVGVWPDDMKGNIFSEQVLLLMNYFQSMVY
jgi:hypothetical protein